MVHQFEKGLELEREMELDDLVPLDISFECL
jgi:hypothetical protein